MNALQKLGQRGSGIIAGIISFVFGLIITLIALRLLFRMFGANPDHSFVNWIYETSEPLVQPFFGIFNRTIDVATGRFEIETLLAIIVYGIVAALLLSLFGGRRAA